MPQTYIKKCWPHGRHTEAVIDSAPPYKTISSSMDKGFMVGRPVARMLNDGLTLEVTRLCTDGTRNACSILYAAAWRVAKNMGYKRIITYILQSEPGTTLRAAGFKEIGLSGGGKWTRPSRERARTTTEQLKIRFEKAA